ncbi:hypothetical protein D3C85_1140080 [compost metagenome]
MALTILVRCSSNSGTVRAPLLLPVGLASPPTTVVKKLSTLKLATRRSPASASSGVSTLSQPL